MVGRLTPLPSVLRRAQLAAGQVLWQQHFGDGLVTQVTLMILRRLFNTKWCGPGGGGTPVNGLDQACMQHDLCYQAIRANPEDNGNGSFWNGAALQACNQQLCNAASQSSDVGAAQAPLVFPE